MHIIEDVNQKPGQHRSKHDWWSENGYTVSRCKLDVGDYIVAPAVSVDTKRNVYELAMDIDGEHERFRRELQRAKDHGTRLVILVENEDGIKDFGGLTAWSESEGHLEMRKRKSGNRNARKIEGLRLAKACKTMEGRYGVKFLFCAPSESAEIITKILEVAR